MPFLPLTSDFRLQASGFRLASPTAQSNAIFLPEAWSLRPEVHFILPKCMIRI